MRSYLTLILLIIFTPLVHAGIETDYPEVSTTILTLGLDLDDFSTVWPLYCNPEWSKVITKNLSKEIKFTREAINNGFFTAKEDDINVKLTMGKTCQALHEYYFNDNNQNVISTFIEKDRALRMQL